MSEVVKISRDGKEAEVVERYAGDFLRDGWVKVDAEPEDHVFDNIESKINASESKDEIESIIKYSFGVDLDKRGSIETVREKALSIVTDSQPE
jgi:hypothetical protein